jgi:hypothetical protein
MCAASGNRARKVMSGEDGRHRKTQRWLRERSGSGNAEHRDRCVDRNAMGDTRAEEGTGDGRR